LDRKPKEKKSPLRPKHIYSIILKSIIQKGMNWIQVPYDWFYGGLSLTQNQKSRIFPKRLSNYKLFKEKSVPWTELVNQSAITYDPLRQSMFSLAQ
jgi:uncharacterized protein YjiK